MMFLVFAKRSRRAYQAQGGASLRRGLLLLRLVERVLQDLLGLLEGRDLLRARSLAIRVRRVPIHASVLQILLVLHSRLQLLAQAALASLLHLGVLLLLGLVDLRAREPRVVLLLLRGLIRAGAGLHGREVRRDVREQPDHVGAAARALVRATLAALPELRLRLRAAAAHGLLRGELDELPGLLLHLARGLVEVLEDGDGLGDGRLRVLRVLDGRRVLRLLLLALLRRRLDLSLEARDSLRVLLDAGRELGDLRRQLVHRRLKLLLLRRLVLLHHRGLVDLLVAPVLVVVLVLLLRHEVEDHLLDHVLDLVERARARGLLERRDLVRQLRQSLGLLRAAGLAEEVDDRLARVLVLRELHEADTLALRSASARDLLEHLDGLAHSRGLTRPALHALVVLVRARVALLLRLVQLLLGRRERLRRALEIRLRRRKVLALLALDLGLAVLRAGSRVDLVLLRRIRELVRAHRRRLRLVQLHQVILELELQVLQRLDDVPALEVVSALTAPATSATGGTQPPRSCPAAGRRCPRRPSPSEPSPASPPTAPATASSSRGPRSHRRPPGSSPRGRPCSCRTGCWPRRAGTPWSPSRTRPS